MIYGMRKDKEICDIQLEKRRETLFSLIDYVIMYLGKKKMENRCEKISSKVSNMLDYKLLRQISRNANYASNK